MIWSSVSLSIKSAFEFSIASLSFFSSASISISFWFFISFRHRLSLSSEINCNSVSLSINLAFSSSVSDLAIFSSDWSSACIRNQEEASTFPSWSFWSESSRAALSRSTSHLKEDTSSSISFDSPRFKLP
ncbi:hypothetical protein CARUB_v10027371mg [Capsella rubella]|uniref:Uncharacterized protein n=1 Tax=Capsella rubella TaxID=81985 RepID=R0GPC8_9BRAS|nr:hypothetical protein CARUB_v10027371mg [Capsella rubella]